LKAPSRHITFSFPREEERSCRALCGDEVTLTVSQYVDSKVKLDGGEKNKFVSPLKSPAKIRNQFLIFLVMVKNQVYRISLGLILV